MSSGKATADALRTRLADELGVVAWRDIKPHYDRDAVFLVSRKVDLLDAAVAVAGDDVAAVKGWLGSGDVSRPDPELAAAWSEVGAPPLRCVITQPYVLIQPIPD